MINKEEYKARIQWATPAQLVVINYELIEAFLLEALAAHEAGETQSRGDSLFAAFVDKAKQGLTQLIRGLDFDVAIAHDLYHVYRYIEGLLNTAFFSRSRDAAEEALSLTRTLLAAWREAADQEARDEQHAASGAPQVYAGLTYARDGLAEYVVQDDQRGFKA